MKNLKIAFVAACTVALSSCSISGPLLITDNQGGPGTKKGEASAKYILGIFGPMHADLSIKKACEEGGITKVSTVDTKISGGLFSKTYTTVVTGE